MHKCINNSIGNVYHLEQFVSDFFPYSQKQLGFDKPAIIRFESDEDNAGVLLGKTAYYDPDAMEVVLYVDGRHPKDVMRSLSHELVHHAQNCRGDFTEQNSTGLGYAQSDPHLRKMEREAYTKGNLIFRDFEDLIKTGKINIEIDFSESGESQMSLKEWKDNEINTKLMKKWGFLKEGKEVTTEDIEELEEFKGIPAQREKQRSLKGMSADPKAQCRELQAKISQLEGDLAEASRDPHGQAQYYIAQDLHTAQAAAKEARCGLAENLEEGHEHGPECGCPDMEEGMKYREEDKPEAKLQEKTEGEETYDYGEAEGHDEKELHDLVKRHATKSHIDALKRDMDYDEDHEDRHERGTDFREGKISVREAKQITRRIIERIRKEGK